MPPSIRPEGAITQDWLAAIVGAPGSPVTDLAQIGVMRAMVEGGAANLAEIYFSLYLMWSSWFVSTATGTDLDVRGSDLGVPRDPGQAASGTVTWTRLSSWIEDIALALPQVITTIGDPTQTPVYRTLQAAMLLPQGRSLSATTPATTTTSAVNDQLRINLDGDGARTISLGTLGTGALIASTLQTLVRALAAITPAKQPAYTTFRADWNATTPGCYTFRSGTTGVSSSVVVSDGLANDATTALKLGLAHGGTEALGMDTLAQAVVAQELGTRSNTGAETISVQLHPVPGILSVLNPLPFANGRLLASDEAYRQDLRAALLALGRGTPDAIDRAVAGARNTAGFQDVQSVQRVDSVGHTVVYITDGRSSTIGAQSDVIQAVQDELDGFGSMPGGWVPSGNTAVAIPAAVKLLDLAATVRCDPATTDVPLTQTAIVQALRAFVTRLPIGTTATYVTLVRTIDTAIPGTVLSVAFTAPIWLTSTPPLDIPLSWGEKLMPGALAITVVLG